MLRTKIVEFLTQVYVVFCKEIHEVFEEVDLYNTLLFFFELYPFHNVLHAKVAELINHLLDKSYDDMVTPVLENVLIKKILDISKENWSFKF